MKKINQTAVLRELYDWFYRQEVFRQKHILQGPISVVPPNTGEDWQDITIDWQDEYIESVKKNGGNVDG